MIIVQEEEKFWNIADWNKVFENYYLLITIIPIVSLIMYISLAFQLIKIKTNHISSL